MPSSKPILGVNDLQSQFPDIAAEAYGWDAEDVTRGSSRKLPWKCKSGHIWQATANSRTRLHSGCPFCAGQRAISGVNDLHSQFPDVAAQADGWDPKEIFPNTNKKFRWKCNKNHTWFASPNSRINMKTGCPICSGNQVLEGFNDLKTKFPGIASEAHGWDPSTSLPGSNKKREWKCRHEHIWSAIVNSRTGQGSGCPVCSGNQVKSGFNDLQTKFPEIASEAFEWNPSLVTAGSNTKRQWRCTKGHVWTAYVGIRTSQQTGCPVCAKSGFNQSKDAWFYLMQRSGEQQLGVTNEPSFRLKAHERNGWTLLDRTTEPALGQVVYDTENAFKKWLKKEIGLMEGTTENWSTTKMEVHSLAELKARSGIETDLF